RRDSLAGIASLLRTHETPQRRVESGRHYLATTRSHCSMLDFSWFRGKGEKTGWERGASWIKMSMLWMRKKAFQRLRRDCKMNSNGLARTVSIKIPLTC